jgi:rsbT co-antagonist protein RsbR
MKQQNAVVDDVLGSEGEDVLREWLHEVAGGGGTIRPSAAQDAAGVLDALNSGVRAGGDVDRLDGPVWERLRASLEEISRSQAAQGVSAADTSRFVLSLKRPLFVRLHRRLQNDSSKLFDAVWTTSTLVDAMAQFTASAYQRSREDVIARQQVELLELSTPVVKLWEGVLAVPMIGTLDSSRTQLVMEALLERIVDTGSGVAIIDITGVPTVDTLVAQHLLKTVAAIRLMGADCIISGVRPQIAQTIVHLGIDLAGVTTKATLADALSVAIKRAGFTVMRNGAQT